MGREVVIVAYGRSAVCRSRKGSLAAAHPIDYSAQVLKGVLKKVPQLKPSDIEDVIMGCAVQHYQTSMNIARSVVLRAGLPETVAGFTMNRFCSSGLQAIATAANAIAANQGDVIIAGGVEDMSHTYEPYPEEYREPWLDEHEPGAYMGMGLTAENVAKDRGITRREMDEMAEASHRKAHKAQQEGKLAPSIIPVTVKDADGREITVTEDEGIRPDTTADRLASLNPCFIPAEEGGLVTAATSSQTSDAAAFVILMEKGKAETLGIRPVALMRSFAIAGCDPTIMGLGPIFAAPKALSRAGLSMEDMDVIELNEAFAAQAIPCIRELKMNPEKVNPYGGAMALGHPMGATGAVLTGKALDYLQDTNGRYALVTMCIGGGMGAAAVFEKV